jgi:hypothetical protein
MTPCRCQAPQTGVATLAIALVLLVATTIMSFALARTSLLEQRILQNELRATEAFHRAEGALERGMITLQHRRMDELGWQAAEPGHEHATLALGGLAFPDAVSGEVYHYRLGLRRASAAPDYLELIAEAQGSGGIGSRVRQYALVMRPLSRELPPMVLDGCLGASGGGLQFYPAQEDPVSLATTHANPGGSCIDGDALDLQGGHIEEGHAGAGALWDTLFDLDKEEHRQRSAQERAAVGAGALDVNERGYYWVDDSSSQWPSHFGSPDDPVWIVFSAAADCPPLPDGLVIHGIVYYETGVSGQCDAATWGMVDVHGSVLVEGSLVNLGAGSRFHHYEHARPEGLAIRLKPLHVARIPGTWRDF